MLEEKTTKRISYLRIIIFCISIIGFVDLIINPKPIEYLNSKLNIITAILIILCLLIFIAKELLKEKLKLSSTMLKGIKIMFLLLILIYINAFLKRFSFYQNVDYIIVAYHTLPIVVVIKDLISNRIKAKYLIFTGVLLLIPTLIYFNFIYKPYEGYWNETPILFIHHRIRNWICFIGITVFLVSIINILEKKTNPSNI